MFNIDAWETWYNNLKVGDEVMWCVYGNSWRKTTIEKVNKKSVVTTGNMKWMGGTRKLNHIHIVRLYPADYTVNGMSFI